MSDFFSEEKNKLPPETKALIATAAKVERKFDECLQATCLKALANQINQERTAQTEYGRRLFCSWVNGATPVTYQTEALMKQEALERAALEEAHGAKILSSLMQQPAILKREERQCAQTREDIGIVARSACQFIANHAPDLFVYSGKLRSELINALTDILGNTDFIYLRVLNS